MFDLDTLKFDEKGLIPAIVTDAVTGEVLTLAYMNRESLEISIKEKRTCFWSRSRRCLWRKGETSGNVQHIVSITADCDRDALTVRVIKDGPACHLGTDSCFTNEVYADAEAASVPSRFTLGTLAELLRDRREHPKEGSYTNNHFDKGID
ncbi:MAG: phosphoribosyl-AMP cyclohydrolase, partial [Clostridia bacterium]|nr:phosphoribosyl-AMP cyclohydrolase [Clostridia bacterium]